MDSQSEQPPQSQVPSEKAKGKVTSGIKRVIERLKTYPSQHTQHKQLNNTHDLPPEAEESLVDYEIKRILALREKEPPHIKREREEQYMKEQLFEPVIAYHGTDKDFEEFKPGQLAYFTEKIRAAFINTPERTRKIVKLVELHIAYPCTHLDEFSLPYYIGTLEGRLDFVKKWKALGYDGATWEDAYFDRIWIPFDNSQIKILATSVEGQSQEEIAKYFGEVVAKRGGKVMLPGEMTKKLRSLYLSSTF